MLNFLHWNLKTDIVGLFPSMFQPPTGTVGATPNISAAFYGWPPASDVLQLSIVIGIVDSIPGGQHSPLVPPLVDTDRPP